MTVNHWLLSAAATYHDARSLPKGTGLTGDISAKWTQAVQGTGVDATRLADAAASYLALPRADFGRLEIEFARQLPESIARTHLVVPLVMDGSRALVAAVDPADTATLDELAFTLGMPVTGCVATPEEVERVLADIYGDAGDVDWGTVPSSLLATELILRRQDGANLTPGASATAKLFGEMLRRAVHISASDIHIQPYGDSAVVRNRIDGVLYRAVDLPGSVHNHLVRHVKAISGMDPTQHLVPQDAKLRMELEHREVDLRLSVLPVGASERLVIRLLPQNQVRSLDMLRLDGYELERLRILAQKADGMILMTGPTGSGKTSLLYAMLAEKNTPDINIMTVEEPVEYRLRGASQINVEPRTGLTFAAALRSILRQDPDVLMVGEIRDEETAGIAAQAAMTGHFVLSTVHTLDALLATVRMRDLGVSSATLADALHAVASQRLVRGLCQICRVPLDTSQFSVDEQRFSELWSAPAWKSTGCESCRSTGYSGRVPVIEVVEISGELKKMLRESAASLDQLEFLAAKAGTRFLAEGFATRIAQGDTTVEEVIRVYGRGFFGRLHHIKNLHLAVGESVQEKT